MLFRSNQTLNGLVVAPAADGVCPQLDAGGRSSCDNNTCVAPPRMLIAFLENNLQADGRVLIPEALRMYMGGKTELVPVK